MTAQEEQMNQFFQELLSAPSAPVTPPATSAATAPDDENALLHSLFGLMQKGLMQEGPMQEQAVTEPNLDGLLGTDPSAMDDTTLVARLDQQFQDLCETFIALKTRPVAEAHPEILMRLESYLAGAQAEIESLVPEGLPESPVVPVKPFTTQKKNSKIRQLRSRAIVLCSAALCLPLALKLGVPALLGSRRIEPLLSRDNAAMDQVVSVQGSTLSIKAPGQSPQSIQLAGFAPADQHWQKEATGVISALLESSHGKVSVNTMGQSLSGGASALVELPNGTMLQQVLLEDGVAQLDNDSLSRFPADVSAKLQAAESSAQSQRKNIWSANEQ